MELLLILIATTCFIGGLGFGLTPVWLVGTTALVLLLYLGLRYPRGRADWKHTPLETAYTLSTMVTMNLFVYVIYLSATVLRLPGSGELTVALAALGFMAMFLAGLLYPAGGKWPLRSRK